MPTIMGMMSNRLSKKSDEVKFTEEKGFNMEWSVSIRFEIEDPARLGDGAGSVSRNIGGSHTISNEQSTSTTDSGELSTGVKTAVEGVEVSAGGKVGTATTRGTRHTSIDEYAGGGSVQSQELLSRKTATLVAIVTVDATAEFSGTDYINPFKWGYSLGDTAFGKGPITRRAAIGTVVYDEATGFIGAQQPNPVQRRGWIEHELGIGAESERLFQRSLDATQIPMAGFSRTSAQSLPPQMQAILQPYFHVDLDNIRLLQDSITDDYCRTIDAAAFTTPRDDAHGVDIFIRRDVHLTGAPGINTLLHEISHAEQQMTGQVNGLNGLGGSAGERRALERSADTKAQTVQDSLSI